MSNCTGKCFLFSREDPQPCFEKPPPLPLGELRIPTVSKFHSGCLTIYMYTGITPFDLLLVSDPPITTLAFILDERKP